MTRYSYDPVASFLGGTVGTQAELLGVAKRTVQRYANKGLTREQAEDVADRFGLHVYELWPDMREGDLERWAVDCEASDCPVRFVPPPTGRGQKRKRYCSRTCQVRTNRRRLRENPVQRERDNEVARQYKAWLRERRKRAA